MHSRGPDAEGSWQDEGIALGHRRLSILDLEPRSNQPMHSADGRYCIVFNGEIYNFREIREELQSLGDVFHTTSDTEVLLFLYARYGEQMVAKLRGMYAFAIWDKISRDLFLARDPYGIKPLYYSHTRRGVLFASQVKALLASGMIDTEIEPAGLAGYYLWGSVPEPWTLYRGIVALRAGSCIRIHQGKLGESVCWHDIRSHWRQNQYDCPLPELQERVRHAVTESVRAHLVSDVPVSVFLSGGIDSGAIAGLISQLGTKVEGVTIGFREFEQTHNDEVPMAAAIAAHYGLDHHVRLVDRAEFESDLPEVLDAMDQPSIDGLNTWFASKAAAERGYKVVLSGVGGDELFYGYNIVREIARDTRRRAPVARIPGARHVLKQILGAAGPDRFHPKVQGVPRYMGSVAGEYFLRRSLFLPEELPRLMGREQAQIGLHRLGGSLPGVGDPDAVNPEGAVCMLDSTLYMRNQLLRDSDWASMAHSLELRTPLADVALLDALDTVHSLFKDGVGKRLLAQSPLKPLPDEVIHRRKTGFTIPMTEWLNQAINRSNWDHFPILAGKKTPWTRRWAHIVLESFQGADANILRQSRAI